MGGNLGRAGEVVNGLDIGAGAAHPGGMTAEDEARVREIVREELEQRAPDLVREAIGTAFRAALVKTGLPVQVAPRSGSPDPGAVVAGS